MASPANPTSSTPEPGSGAALSVAVDATTRRITLDGELDLAGRTLVRECLPMLDGRERITVDLSGLRFIDAAGLGAIVDVKAAAGDLRLVGASDVVARTFTLGGLRDLLPRSA